METIALNRRESHPDEIARLMRGDGSATSRAPSEGLPGAAPWRAFPAGEPTHLLTAMDDGRWQASVRCPRCGAMSGWIGALAQCQGLIDRNQRHIAECGGIPAPPPFARVEHCTCCGSWRGPRDAETEARGA